MKTQTFNIRYLVIHIIPAHEWFDLPYQNKKEYHHLVTVTGKKIPMKPLNVSTGCIDVAYVGSEQYARDSSALFTLLLQLWIEHEDAKIVYAHELYSHKSSGPFICANEWLSQHMPRWLQKTYCKWHNLFTLKELLPIIY